MHIDRGKAQTVGLIAISINFSLTLIKFLLAIFSGSLALLAEAFHSFSDIGSSIAVYLAVRIDNKYKSTPKSNSKIILFFTKHLQRKVAIIIGIFLFSVGIGISTEVFTYKQVIVKNPALAGLVMLFLALVSLLLSRLELSVGNKEQASALIADGRHARVDAYCSLIVAVALFSESLSLPIDRFVSGLLVIFILVEAIKVFIAVYRDIVSKEDSLVLVYSTWSINLWRRLLTFLWKHIVSFISNILQISEADLKREKKVGIFLSTLCIIAVLFVYFISGFFTVESYQQAIIERFGKPISKDNKIIIFKPGLHYCWPWPIGKVQKLDTQRVRSLVIGSEINPSSRTLLWTNVHYVREHNILTGETIFVDVGMTLHYRIIDPLVFLYAADQPEIILRKIGYTVLLNHFAHQQFFPSITIERGKLENELLSEMKDMLQSYPGSLGIDLQMLNLRDMHPPTNVAEEFEAVVSATVEYETYINDAQGYRNDLIPRERGKAKTTELITHAQSNKKILASKGESQRFLKLLKEYHASPKITHRRLYLETIEKVLVGREKYIVPKETTKEALELFLISNGNNSMTMPQQNPAEAMSLFGAEEVEP
ncbi:MAG: protease modulator HflK family protein [Deltaproteobacteria bacterium]|nr:protease modulator HflK family protein [Deltaproteobacteria bacterium]